MRIAVIGNENIKLVAEAISRLGCPDISRSNGVEELPEADIVVCQFEKSADYKRILAHYNDADAKAICLFNFGIGACATVIGHDMPDPVFARSSETDSAVKTMLDYTIGYSTFWHIKRNSWLSEAEKWIADKYVSQSIGEYTMAAMAAHLVAAIIAGNKTKTYPKFYLSTIVNDIY